ncbi:MAG: DUF2442 domain-containing protein, partial [Treponema sp.]|nr:DUF2442 domain-containing protein [Treponema sp.]
LLNVEPDGNYKLKLFYENGERKIFDVSPYISGDWYGQLQDEKYFRTVHLVAGGAGIEWADGQDIAPHELYELGVAITYN